MSECVVYVPHNETWITEILTYKSRELSQHDLEIWVQTIFPLNLLISDA